MVKRVIAALAATLAGFVFSSSIAATSLEKVQERLQQIDPRLEVLAIQPAPIQGLREVQLNSGDIIYLNEQGDHFFSGSLFRLTPHGLLDLTETSRSQMRKNIIQSIAAQQQVVFPATGGKAKAIIQVFTDVTCPYCSRLHEQVPALNQAGIEVRYLAFPRQGVQSQGYQQLVNVWCATNRQEAMTLAKQGASLPDANCTNPVAEHYSLGQRLGIQGTPAIFLPDGRVIPGFVPAERLISELEL